MRINILFKNNIANLAVIRMVGTAINFSIPILVSNIYNLAMLGEYYIFIASVYGLSLLSRMGLDYWIVKEVSSKKMRINSIYYSAIFSSILLSCLLLLMICLNQHFLIIPFLQISNVLVVFIGLSAYSLVMINVGLLRGLEKHIFSAVFESCLLPLFIITLITLDYFFVFPSWIKLQVFFVIATCLILILSSLTVFMFISLDSKVFNLDKYVVKKSWSFFGVSITSYAQNWLATLIISMNLSASDVAIFNICQRLIQFSTSIQNIIGNMYSPKFGKSVSLSELKTLARESRKISFKIGSILLLSILLGSPLMFYLANVNYVDGITIIAILGGGYLFSLYCGPVGKVLSMSGNVRYERNIQLSNLLVSFLIIYILTIYMGTIGAAFAMSFSLFLTNSMMTTFVKRKLGFTLF